MSHIIMVANVKNCWVEHIQSTIMVQLHCPHTSNTDPFKFDSYTMLPQVCKLHGQRARETCEAIMRGKEQHMSLGHSERRPRAWMTWWPWRRPLRSLWWVQGWLSLNQMNASLATLFKNAKNGRIEWTSVYVVQANIVPDWHWTSLNMTALTNLESNVHKQMCCCCRRHAFSPEHLRPVIASISKWFKNTMSLTLFLNVTHSINNNGANALHHFCSSGK